MKESGLHREQRQLDGTRPAGLVEDLREVMLDGLLTQAELLRPVLMEALGATSATTSNSRALNPKARGSAQVERSVPSRQIEEGLERVAANPVLASMTARTHLKISSAAAVFSRTPEAPSCSARSAWRTGWKYWKARPLRQERRVCSCRPMEQSLHADGAHALTRVFVVKQRGNSARAIFSQQGHDVAGKIIR
jgi:hypothetical protein